MCVRSFVPPILSHLKAHVWPSSNHQITFPGARVAFRDVHYLSWFARFKRDHSLLNLANQIDMMRLSGNIGSILDMFHEQLPLPVPCSCSPGVSTRHGLYLHPAPVFANWGWGQRFIVVFLQLQLMLLLSSSVTRRNRIQSLRG